ncbi:MAG: YezD family protein [Candidatus Omnitrophica bacterium]|nr:YezD family protein [Candidatus Omnitrophota bacterium]
MSIYDKNTVREESLVEIAVNGSIVKDIGEAVRSLGYGTITVTVRESKIIQLEVTEKRRYDDVWCFEGGGI